MKNNELILVYETQDISDSIVCRDIKMLQKEIVDLYMCNYELKFYVTYRGVKIDKINSETKMMESLDKEYEYIENYCNIVDSVKRMESD